MSQSASSPSETETARAMAEDDAEGERFDGEQFAAFESAVEELVSKRNVVRDFRKNEGDLEAVKSALLDRRRKLPRWGIENFLPRKGGGSNPVDGGCDSAPYAKRKLRERSDAYTERTGLTREQHKMATVLLAHLADHCAKTSSPGPLHVAWEKVMEAGIMPLSRTLSTYLYVLSLEGDDGRDLEGKVDDGINGGTAGGAERDVAAEVAALHDALYEPTEKTTTLLVKSLVSRGDAAGAEALIEGITDGPLSDLRHRTTSPILQLYCRRGDIDSALRLYRKMRTTSRVKMDAATYADFIAAVAENGYFGSDSECIAGAKDLGYESACGPELLDALITEMAEDVLDISEESARVLRNGFAKGFEDGGLGASTDSNADGTTLLSTPRDEKTLVADRVAVDEDTARCPASGAALRLITLEASQRTHVRDTLLEMAREKSREYTSRLAAKGRAKGDVAEKAEEATRILTEFSHWLDEREGEPFTAVVDGANVAYYGWGRINVHQLKHCVDALERQGENVLVVFPKKYTWKKFHLRRGVIQVLSDEEMSMLEGLESRGMMYVVPPMCLDDLYWMLASVSDQKASADGRAIHVPKNNGEGRFPGPRPMVVTNDKMRDHKMDLLDERAFRRWCCSHIVNYDFEERIEHQWEERAIRFRAADVFSDEIQGNVVAAAAGRGGGGRMAWHFPVSEWEGNERFCLRLPA